MKRLALIVCTAVAAVVAASANATTTKPACHWTHHRADGVNVYAQVCTVAKHKRHAANPKWTHAGPGNSPAPRIG